jgi:hypothetical protein
MSEATLGIIVALERERIARRRNRTANRLPWRQWLDTHFASYITAPFAERHIRFWEWISTLVPGEKPQARVEVWPRGGGKSATVELGCAYLGATGTPRRRFVLYVSETQAQADKHVQSVANMLLRAGAQPAKNRLGASQGWRREQVRTANGFNIAAFGLDTGMRGARLDEFRPDLIVFDDVDGRHDTPATVQKKIDIITETVLPSGSIDCAVIIVQNKVHANSIVSQLADNRADFLHDRIPATVEPAVEGLRYEQTINAEGSVRYRITAGTATWDGQDLTTCERQLNEWGIAAFEREAQHNVDVVEGGLWRRDRDIDPFRTAMMPDLERIVVAVDPNTTAGNDEAGILVAGIAHRVYDDTLQAFRLTDDPHGYVLDDATAEGGPRQWAEASVAAYNKWRADALVAERNNGGDMVAITIAQIPGAPPVTLVWASRGKLTRAEPVQTLYEGGRVHHVGRFPALESEMCTWRPLPNADSPNRMDALVWALTSLMLDPDGIDAQTVDAIAGIFG